MVTLTAPNLSDKEVQERVRILTKLRETLLIQREKFQQYLTLLDQQENDIESGNIGKLEQHIEIEHQIIKDIFSFQKVVEPMEEIYRLHYREGETEIPQLKASLERMKGKVLEHNEKNRNLLRQKMATLRQQISNVRIPFPKKSLYAGNSSPVMVDITT